MPVVRGVAFKVAPDGGSTGCRPGDCGVVKRHLTDSLGREQLTNFIPKGDRDKIKAHAQTKGMSLNAYILELVRRDMEG